MSAWTSPGVFVARMRSGLLLFGTVKSMHATRVTRGAPSIDVSSDVLRRWSELELEDRGEIAVLRIVVAVEAVRHRAHFRIVAFVTGPRLEVAATERDRRPRPAIAGNASHEIGRASC